MFDPNNPRNNDILLHMTLDSNGDTICEDFPAETMKLGELADGCVLLVISFSNVPHMKWVHDDKTYITNVNHVSSEIINTLKVRFLD